MAKEGRIEGRLSDDGTAYELVQFGSVRQSFALADAYRNDGLKAAIRRNKWQPLP